MNRQKLQEIEQRVLARGWLDERDLEDLRRVLHDDWKVSRAEADFLVALRKRARARPPGFDELFYRAIKGVLLANGRIGAAETAWLRQVLLEDRKIDDQERRFLRQLRAEAREASPEFEELFKEAMRQPEEQSTRS
jgi:hypothetical protein